MVCVVCLGGMFVWCVSVCGVCVCCVWLWSGVCGVSAGVCGYNCVIGGVRECVSV